MAKLTQAMKQTIVDLRSDPNKLWSYREICEELNRQYGVTIGYSSVQRWYSGSEAKEFEPTKLTETQNEGIEDKQQNKGVSEAVIQKPETYDSSIANDLNIDQLM